MNVGQFEKMVIRSFRDKQVLNELVDTFYVPINPENLSEDSKVQHERSQHMGAQGNDPKFKGSAPNKLTLNLLFDNTGTIEGNKLDGTPITDQLKKFTDTVRAMDPKTHQPLYLKITQNQFNFDCVLTDLKIQHVLYDSVGASLRAKVTANFEEFKEPVKRIRQEDKQSPDLTHLRQVIEGNNLPLMTYQIYGKTKYYLQVAEANGLTNFRRLNVGSQLVFPAIDKEING